MSALPSAVARLKSLGRFALDAVLPPRCLVCAAPVAAAAGTVCAPCWHGITLIMPPLCIACGHPFTVPQGEGALCGACVQQRPSYDSARAVMAYAGTGQDLVLAFKHADKTHAAPTLGRWLARAGSELIAETDIIVPVPLHRLRLARRRYNQAALLAHALARETGHRVLPNALRRARRTRSQVGLNAAERVRNVRGAFVLAPRAEEAVAGCKVLLVDDVLTTGATVSGCTRALRRRGAAAVHVLTLARVVHAQ